MTEFPCEGERLRATLDDAPGSTGLLIVSGGNEIRIGAHRGMARLGREIARTGFPVFRFDRRGIGDSEGQNVTFRGSAPDIAAALMAFRDTCPTIRRVVAFGNCDAASALLIHQLQGIDSLVLANIWVIEPVEGLPSPAAIRTHYSARVRDPASWARLFSGRISFRKLVTGLFEGTKRHKSAQLADDVLAGLNEFKGQVSILLANRDATAIAFIDLWSRQPHPPNISTTIFDSSSHSFASDADFALLRHTLMHALTEG